MFLGIEIGGTKLQLGVGAGAGGPLAALERLEVDRQHGAEGIRAQIGRIAPTLIARHGVTAVGIGFGGPVNFEKQIVALSTHVGGWKDFALSEYLTAQLGIPAIMDNDANVGALGEALYGAGAGFAPTVFYMTVSTGIGGGVVIDGHIYRGADSYAGEIGHLTVRPDGPTCLCGAHGCLERMCCGLWLERDHGRTAKELLRDPEFVRRYVVDLALGIKSCIMLLNPARIVIGGGISKAGPALFDPLRAELRRQITDWSHARIDVVPAALGDDSVLYGAAALTKEIKT